MKKHPDVYAVNICTDCAVWFANRDDSGSADDWRERFELQWAHWENAYPRDSYISVTINGEEDTENGSPEFPNHDREPHFRDNKCDTCNSLPGDQFHATITAHTN